MHTQACSCALCKRRAIDVWYVRFMRIDANVINIDVHVISIDVHVISIHVHVFIIDVHVISIDVHDVIQTASLNAA